MATHFDRIPPLGVRRGGALLTKRIKYQNLVAVYLQLGIPCSSVKALSWFSDYL